MGIASGFWNVVVMKKYTTVFHKQCFTVDEAKKLVAAKKLEYPGKEYSVTRDWY